jgi:hypothetical protein
MDATRGMADVLDLLERLDVEVRREHLGGRGGGICAIRGRRIAFFDLDADPATQLTRCLAGLAGLPELDRMYLKPSLRELIEGGGV